MEERILLGVNIDHVATIRQARAATRTLSEMGYASVVITLGERGVVWRHGEETKRLGGHTVRARDATGAGDTFVGYLATALAQGAGLGDAVRLANAAAALSVTKLGAQAAIPPREKAERFARRVTR